MLNSVTRDESLEALRRDVRELNETFNPQLVRIEPLRAPAGSMYYAKITLLAPCFITPDLSTMSPVRVTSNWCFLDVKEGYPKTKPRVFFEPGRRNASANTFVGDDRMGSDECIDAWRSYSSLTSAVEKTLRDMIHDPHVANYDSPACSALIPWQKDLVAKGVLPTIDPRNLLRRTAVIPTVAQPAGSHTPPPLPSAAYVPPTMPVRQVRSGSTPPPLPGMQ